MNEHDYWHAKREQDSHYGAREQEMRMAILTEQFEYNLFSMLKPRLFIDGDKWCCLYGETQQDGVAGFGSSPYEAIIDWNKQFNKKLKK